MFETIKRHYEDEEDGEMWEAIGVVAALVVWLSLLMVSASIMDIFTLRYLPLFQRNVIFKNEKVMLENEIKYRFATEIGFVLLLME